MNYAIWVYHWDYFEDEVLTQFFCFLGLGEQELEDAVADVGRHCLARVDSCCNHNIPFLKILKRMILSNSQYINPISSQSLTQRTPHTDIPRKRIRLNLLNQIIQISISKRIAISKIDLIPRMRKHIFPSKRIKWFIFRCTFTITILIILNIITCSMPT